MTAWTATSGRPGSDLRWWSPRRSLRSVRRVGRLNLLQARLSARRVPFWLADCLLAALFTVDGVLELASSEQQDWHGAAHAVLMALQTLPVAVRRIAPGIALTTMSTALLIEAVATEPTNTFGALLAGLVLVYTVGRQMTGWPLVAVTVYAAATTTVHVLRLPDDGPTDLAFAAVFCSAAWLAGRSMRRRELERERAEAAAIAERQEAEARRVAAIADERSRIAREMHDIVAHGMGVMVVQAAAAEQLLEVDPESAREPLATVRQTGQAAMAEMRRLLGLLNSGEGEQTAPQPRLAELPALVERLRQAGMPVTMTVTGAPTASLPAGLELCVYRIVQEALTNSLKHAGQVATSVELDHRDDCVAVQVRNAPSPQPPSTAGAGTGHGLVGMRERVRLYGGELAVGPRPDGSFVVSAALPTGA
jgi:signal transduction histidine kinase